MFTRLFSHTLYEDNGVSAANKTHRVLFYLKKTFTALSPDTFIPLHKLFISLHLENAFQAPHPILSLDAEA